MPHRVRPRCQETIGLLAHRRTALTLIAAISGGLASCSASLTGQPVGAGSEFTPQAVALANDSVTPSKPGVSPITTGALPPADIEAANDLMAANNPANAAYKIGPQDVLEVSVFKVPELSRSVQVANVGTINLPLVGEVQAAGRTARDVEQDLTRRLGEKYLQSPQVTVLIKEYNSRRVTVEGDVKKPGVYPIRERTTLLQFISIAQGVTETSDTGSILVFRTINGQRSTATFDLDEIRAGDARDPEIRDGDVIVVNTSAAKSTFQTLIRTLPAARVFYPLF